MALELDLLNEDLQNKEGLDDLEVPVEQINNAVLWGTDWTAETVVTQMTKKKIDLNPNFQRREAWDDKRKSAFIESLICGFPIPQIILAESKAKNGSYIVIDGKQRLLSLRRFFATNDDHEFQPLRLRGLEVLKDLNGKTFEEIKDDPAISSYVDAAENQSIRTTVIKNWPSEEFLYNVFLRLNTGSLPLSTQELRQALHPGAFLDYCDQYSYDNANIRRILNITKPDYRMRDIELMVRYYAFKHYSNEYNGNLKTFFDDSVSRLNQKWIQDHAELEADAADLDAAIELTYRIFETNAFRKWKNGSFDSRFNRAIFDIMVYYFSKQDVRATTDGHDQEIKTAFVNECTNNPEFLSSFETSTKNARPTQCRYTRWGTILSEILGVELQIPVIPNGAE